jgi:hypothetical protein
MCFLYIHDLTIGLQDGSVIWMLREMQDRLDNMSVMGMELCCAMGIDMTSLLETLDVES